MYRKIGEVRVSSNEVMVILCVYYFLERIMLMYVRLVRYIVVF